MNPISLQMVRSTAQALISEYDQFNGFDYHGRRTRVEAMIREMYPNAVVSEEMIRMIMNDAYFMCKEDPSRFLQE